MEFQSEGTIQVVFSNYQEKNHQECQEKTGRIQDRINVFFERYHTGTLLNYSGIRKVLGTSPLNIFMSIFSLLFYGVNFFRGIVQNKELDFLKDAAYDFLKGWKYNWRNLLIQTLSGSNDQVNRTA